MERTGAKAERTYQSGKTRRRNANKKKCLLRRRMLAQSAMASPAQNPPIQVVDVDVPNALSNISMPIGSTTKARSGDTLIAELKETEKPLCSNHTVVLMKKTAEVSDTQETSLSVMESLETTETESVSSDEICDAQFLEDDEENFEENEPDQVDLDYTVVCVRIKDNTFAYAGQTEW